MSEENYEPDLNDAGYEDMNVDGDRQRAERLFYSDPKNKGKWLL